MVVSIVVVMVVVVTGRPGRCCRGHGRRDLHGRSIAAWGSIRFNLHVNCRRDSLCRPCRRKPRTTGSGVEQAERLSEASPKLYSPPFGS